MSRSIEWLPSLFFFLSFFLSFADSCISHDGKTDKRARSLGADTQVHQKVRVKWWLVHPWLAGWLAPEALVGKLQRSLPRFISRLRASISMPRSIFSPALHPLSSSTRRRFTRSLARSLYFREGLISLLSRIQCGKWTEFAKLGDPDSADSPPQRS